MSTFGRHDHYPDGNVNRRNFLIKAAGVVGGVLLLDSAFSDNSRHNGPTITETYPAPEHRRELSYPATFENHDAEAVSRELHLNAGGYFRVTPKTVEAMTNGRFQHEQDLLPIFAPGVARYKDKLKNAAEVAGLPTNLLGIIATIESSGRPTARSGADAWGLLQVVPQYHIDGFIKHGFLPAKASYADYQKVIAGHSGAVSFAKYRQAFTSPDASLLVGADYLAQCVAAARRNQSHLDPNSPVIFALAAAGYNGGVQKTASNFNAMPEQTQLYVNHVTRMLIDVEIAGRLKQNGMNDKSILKAMWSNEMNARAYSYKELAGRAGYDERAHLAGEIQPGIPAHNRRPHSHLQKLAHGYYEAYRHGRAAIPTPTHKYIIPAPPGLRIWLAGGGDSLFDAVPVNAGWRV